MRRRDFIAGGLVTAKLSRANWLSSDGAQHLYNLDYERALNVFEADSRRDLAGDAYNDLASAILYSVLFKADALDGAVALGISDYLHKPKVILPATDRVRFQQATRKAEELARMLLAKNPHDAAAMFTLGQAFTERANLALLADKEWRAALKASGEARKLHRANVKQACEDIAACELQRVGLMTVFSAEKLSSLCDKRLRELWRAVWQRENWRDGAMTRQHWQRLADVSLGKITAVDCPDGIRVRRLERVVRAGPGA